LAATLWFNAKTKNTEAQNRIEQPASAIAAGTSTIDPPTVSPTATLTATPDTPTQTPTGDPSSSATAAATQTANATLTAAASASAGAGATPAATVTPAPTVSGITCSCCASCSVPLAQGQTCDQACGNVECAQSCPTPGPNDNCTCATSQSAFCAFMSGACLPQCANCNPPAVATEVPPIVYPTVGVVISTPITEPGTGELKCSLPSCPSYKFPQECSYQFGCYQLTWTFKSICSLVSSWPGYNGIISVGICMPTGQIVDQCDKQACCAAVGMAVCENNGVQYCCSQPSCNGQVGQISCGGVCCDQAKCAYNLLNQPSICCNSQCTPDVGWCNCCGDGTCATDEKTGGAHPCPKDCETTTPTAVATVTATATAIDTDTPVPPTPTLTATSIPATHTPSPSPSSTASQTSVPTFPSGPGMPGMPVIMP
jgi:hypothetical protein